LLIILATVILAAVTPVKRFRSSKQALRSLSMSLVDRVVIATVMQATPTKVVRSARFCELIMQVFCYVEKAFARNAGGLSER